ncbi:uncharacterized protein LOC123310925 [Coccinella septempunctata]|uniref:uncharacterized protein LOC123310925 n=1 Tax=Coccinella septempunctata TaxID=41139 RepID=UPI001D095FC7|nr:uncharacterized protein LOC123310925 [Coccinella septempunctata]
MSNIPNIPIWADFFECLRDLPELWKVKSDVFKDRNKKNRGWDTLLEVYKKIDPNAHIDSLKKRVNNIKSTYRRELKKVEQSKRSGAGAEDEYIPNLWYYDKVDFLRDQEIQIPGISTMETEQSEREDVENEQEGSLLQNIESEPAPESSTSFSPTPKRKKKSMVQHMSERNDLLKEALGRLSDRKKNTDEADTFAESWATSYRKLSHRQKIFAKKAIEDIFALGQLELLSFNSVDTSCASRTSSTGPTTSSSHYTSNTPSPISEATASYTTMENVPYTNIEQLFSDDNYI